jgi:hypothetical protein
MDNKNHTKGKWYLENTPDYIIPKCSTIEIYSSDNMNGWICKVQNNGVIGEEEGKANALLISKAPEMLEILNHLHGRIDFSCDAWGSNEGIELSNKIGQLIKSATEINE